MIHRMPVTEAYLGLGGVDVDINMVRRQLQKEKSDRVTPRHQQAAKCLLHCMAQAAVADPTAVEEQVLHLGVAALTGRVGNVAVQPGRSLLHLDAVQFVADLRSKEEADAIQQASRR